MECVFCNIEKIQSKVKEFKNCFIFEPLNPVTPGHLLVVHKLHTKDFTEDPKTFGETCEVAAEYAEYLGGEFNLITSKGPNATQTVFHTHVHLVPRREGDGLFLPWSNQH